jgi:nitrile hydratase
MFGLEIPAGKEVRVFDSTSDVRYFVLPERPDGTEGMDEAELAKLVTVDSLIGAGEPLLPPGSAGSPGSRAAPNAPRVRAD